MQNNMTPKEIARLQRKKEKEQREEAIKRDAHIYTKLYCKANGLIVDGLNQLSYQHLVTLSEFPPL